MMCPTKWAPHPCAGLQPILALTLSDLPILLASLSIRPRCNLRHRLNNRPCLVHSSFDRCHALLKGVERLLRSGLVVGVDAAEEDEARAGGDDLEAVPIPSRPC